MTATASTAGGAVAGAGSELTHLWQPLDIGPTRVKHRIMQTAQTVLYADDHVEEWNAHSLTQNFKYNPFETYDLFLPTTK